jgi:EcsC protein family
MARPVRRLSPEGRAILQRAHEALERPSFAARLSGVLGTPVQAGLSMLPPGLHARIQDATEAAIARALDVAIVSLRGDPPYVLHDQAHRTLALATGALGGFFGLPGVLLELPLTTVVILRSIADVAHSYGEDLEELETRLACMQVFAVGGRSHGDDNFEIGYYEVRAALGFHLSTLAAANGALTTHHIPGALGLVRAIAARFGLVVSDKLAVQMVPLIGAATGALINDVFMRYFQEVARGHFAIRDLERRYGAPAIEAAYRELTLEAQKAARRRASPPLAAVVVPPPGAGTKIS